jgi:hypothetical protein
MHTTNKETEQKKLHFFKDLLLYNNLGAYTALCGTNVTPASQALVHDDVINVITDSGKLNGCL